MPQLICCEKCKCEFIVDIEGESVATVTGVGKSKVITTGYLIDFICGNCNHKATNITVNVFENKEKDENK